MIRYEKELTRKEVGDFKIALLPIGATEQHGDHMPLGTDSYLTQDVISQLVERQSEIHENIMILPLVEYGKSTEHLGIPGTISLSARTLIGLLEDICDSLKRSDFDTLLIVNGHGGNTGIIEGVSYDLRDTYGIDVFSFPLGRIFAEYSPIGGLPKSMHAGVAETSIMRHTHPEFGEYYGRIPAKATDTDGLELLEILGCSSWGWKTGEITPDGYIGDPKESSPELGKCFLDFTVQRIMGQIQAITQRRMGS